MNKKNLLSGREKELFEMAERYEKSKAENRTIYMDADDWADLADWYAVRRKYDIAKEVTEYGLSLHPANTPLLVEQAYLYLDTSEKNKAEEIVKQITEQTPEVTILRAQLLLEEGKLEETELLLSTIETKDDLANIVEASYMYIDMGYPEKAMEWIKLGIGKYDKMESFIAVHADCCYAQRQIDEAIEYYNRLIDLNPYSAAYWFGLARCYFDQGQLDKAIEACDYATVADEEFADAYIMKGNAFYELGNEENAMANYKRAEELKALSPCFIDTFMGMERLAGKEWKKAYEYFEKAIACSLKGDPSPLPVLYANIAFCLHKMGETEQAAQYWEMAHDLAPDDPTPYLMEGRAHMDDYNPKAGISCWNKAIRISPYAETWHEIGSDCIELYQLEYARIAFEHVKELDPDFENINEKLTIVSMLLHDKESAQKYNRQCKHPIDQERLEDLYQQLKDADKNDMASTIKNIIDSLF